LEGALPDRQALSESRTEPSLEEIQDRLAAIEASLMDVKNRTKRLPTKWQSFFIMSASAMTVLGICALFALAFLIAAEGDMR
jgi:hypothetical protein